MVQKSRFIGRKIIRVGAAGDDIQTIIVSIFDPQPERLNAPRLHRQPEIFLALPRCQDRYAYLNIVLLLAQGMPLKGGVLDVWRSVSRTAGPGWHQSYRDG